MGRRGGPRGQRGCAVCGRRPPPRALDQGKGGPGDPRPYLPSPALEYLRLENKHPLLNSLNLGLLEAARGGRWRGRSLQQGPATSQAATQAHSSSRTHSGTLPTRLPRGSASSSVSRACPLERRGHCQPPVHPLIPLPFPGQWPLPGLAGRSLTARGVIRAGNEGGSGYGPNTFYAPGTSPWVSFTPTSKTRRLAHLIDEETEARAGAVVQRGPGLRE